MDSIMEDSIFANGTVFATFDTIGDSTTGPSFVPLESGEYHLWAVNILRFIKARHWLQVAREYPRLAELSIC